MDADKTRSTALREAVAAGRDAADLGFDWTHALDALTKVIEEAEELRIAITADPRSQAVAEELGDLYFAVSNVARKLQLDPELTLAAATEKFKRRFNSVVSAVRQTGREPHDLSLDELEEFWVASKLAERSPPP